MARARSSSNNSTANLGFEAKLGLAADKLRSSTVAAFFNDSDTALRGSATLRNRPNPQVVRGAQDNFRKDDDVRWQWSNATWTGSPEGEHNSAHQYGVPPRGNANFAWVQHFIHHLAPHGMAGFVLVRFWFWSKSKAARVLKSSDNSTPVSFRERRRETLLVEGRTLISFGKLGVLHSLS